MVKVMPVTFPISFSSNALTAVGVFFVSIPHRVGVVAIDDVVRIRLFLSFQTFPYGTTPMPDAVRPYS